MCVPEQRVVRAPVRVKRAFMKPDTPVTKCIRSYWLQRALHGYTTRTLAFALALRFLKRDLLSHVPHQVQYLHLESFASMKTLIENIISDFFSVCKNRWYRAQVMGSRPDDEYDVFYVDFGDREWVTRDRIVPAWSGILQLPLQAIECSLVNVQPIGEHQSSMNCTPSNSLIRQPTFLDSR